MVDLGKTNANKEKCDKTWLTCDTTEIEKLPCGKHGIAWLTWGICGQPRKNKAERGILGKNEI